MGLLDELSNLAGGISGGSGSPDISGMAQHLLTQEGGLQGLVQKFEQSGLGSVAASWIGTGQNQPVSAEQITQVLGEHGLNDLAAKFGVDPQQVSTLLAQHLPGLVDHLTPNGQMPEMGQLASEGLSLLKGFFNR